MKSIRTILVATDFSECAQQAVEEAVELARQFTANLTLLHVYHLPAHAYMEGSLLYSDEIRKAVEAQALSELGKLKTLAERRLERGVEARTLMGVPYVEIVEEARRGNYDLIVVGTHGRTGLKHFFLGSVAERVVQLAPCRVLTVRRGAQ
jgi:nucleotide-binding universal stress UspA family protein